MATSQGNDERTWPTQLLRHLDAVNWPQLQHAYGSAGDVPAQIRGLLSSHVSIRDDSLSSLFGNIWHQGTVYEATVYAIPFLAEILRSDAAPDRPPIAMLLACITAGHGFLEVHAAQNEARFREMLDRHGQSLEQELEREREIVARVRAEAVKVLPFLIPYLNDAESEVRASVAEALAAIPDVGAAHVGLLRNALDLETDAEARQRIRESLSSLQAGRVGH
jgi:hypothetical protein